MSFVVMAPVDTHDKNDPRQKSSSFPYLVAVMVMAVLTVLAIVAITALRPAADNSALIGLVITATAPTTVALLAFMKAQETHLSVNSRLDAFMSTAKQISRMEGVQEGMASGVQASATVAAAAEIASALVTAGAKAPIVIAPSAKTVALEVTIAEKKDATLSGERHEEKAGTDEKTHE